MQPRGREAQERRQDGVERRQLQLLEEQEQGGEVEERHAAHRPDGLGAEVGAAHDHAVEGGESQLAQQDGVRIQVDRVRVVRDQDDRDAEEQREGQADGGVLGDAARALERLGQPDREEPDRRSPLNFIEYYNCYRPHGALNYMSPKNYLEKYYSEM